MSGYIRQIARQNSRKTAMFNSRRTLLCRGHNIHRLRRKYHERRGELVAEEPKLQS